MSQTMTFILNIILWAGVVCIFSWFIIRTIRRSESPLQSGIKLAVTMAILVAEGAVIRLCVKKFGGGTLADFVPALILAGSVAVCGILLSLIWTRHIVNALISPLTNMFDGGNEAPDPKPLYSIALAKRKFGKSLEAIALIREQLAKFPNDFEGVMLLADILAEDMNDLQGAEITLNNFCNSKNAPPRQVTAALTRIADWQMKLGADVYSARLALEQICSRYPNTELSLQAEERIAHLGGTEKIILEHHDPRYIEVPQGARNIGLLDSTDFLKPTEAPPGQRAAAFVSHLEAHPQDSDAREKLAVLYATEFQRLDMATMELEQLISQPNRAPKQVIHWLNLLANFQVQLGADEPTIRATLNRIVELYPKSPAAEIVQRRLARLNTELAGLKETSTVKLGEYEQNIGLKYGRPPRM